MSFSILPEIPVHKEPRDWRAAVALVASIAGAIAFTFFSAALVYIMWRGGWAADTAGIRIEVLGRAMLLSLTGSLVVLITLGFAINRRSIKVSKDGFEATGGDGDSATTATVTATVSVPENHTDDK